MLYGTNLQLTVQTKHAGYKGHQPVFPWPPTSGYICCNASKYLGNVSTQGFHQKTDVRVCPAITLFQTSLSLDPQLQHDLVL